jgi:hypothetical protein
MRLPFLFSNGFAELESTLLRGLAITQPVHKAPFTKGKVTEKIVELLMSLANLTSK